MFKIGEHVVYKHDVCLLKEVKKGRDDKEYYVLVPITDNTLKIEIPTDLANKNIKKLITKEYALELIQKMKEIEVIKIDTKLLESVYK